MLVTPFLSFGYSYYTILYTYDVTTIMTDRGSEEKGLHVSLTYDTKYLPESLEAAEKEVYNYIRRIGHKRKRMNLPPLKYILVTEYHGGENGEEATRMHHHIMMNGGLDRDEVEDLWRRKRKKGEKQGERIGFANADRIQSNDDGISALSAYLCKGISDKPGKKKKKWSSSHNLERPTSRTNDRSYSKRAVQRLATSPPPKEFWEKKYPGWTPTSPDYGVTFEFNEVTASWSIYLKLRRKD